MATVNLITFIFSYSFMIKDKRTKIKYFFVWIPIIIFFFGYNIALRLESNTHGLVPYLNIILSKPDVIFHNTLFNIYYTFIFGFVATSETIKLYQENISNLLTCINPLPGSLTNWYLFSQKLRINIYAPFTAIGEMAKFPVFSFFYYIFLGYYFSFCDFYIKTAIIAKRYFAPAIIIILLCLFILFSFEYNLRSSISFIYYFAFILFLFIRKINWKSYIFFFFNFILNKLGYLFGVFVFVPNRVKPYLVLILFLTSIILYRKSNFTSLIKKALPLLVLFFMYLLSLFYTSDLNQGVLLIVRMLPLIILPFSFSLIGTNNTELFFSKFKTAFIFCLVIYSIFILFYLYKLDCLFGNNSLNYGYSYITNEFYGFNDHPIYISSYYCIGLLLIIYNNKSNIYISSFSFIIILLGLILLSRKGSIIAFFLILIYYFILNKKNVLKILFIIFTLIILIFTIP